jgi:hypothetical protein
MSMTFLATTSEESESRIIRVVGQGLQIGDEDEGVVLMLQAHSVAERADVVAEMQRSGGPVSGEDGACHGSAPFRLITDEGIGAAADSPENTTSRPVRGGSVDRRACLG